jgi:signal transduction histidine kinase
MKTKALDRKGHFSLTLLFSVVIFVILLIAVTLASLTVWLLNHLKLLGTEQLKISEVVMLMAAISAAIGFAITLLLLKFPLTPINTLINKMNALADGKFDTRLEYKGLFDVIPGFTELKESFNTLARELDGTEMLRSDFINNFSHEFKTPIVSISGLAGLLAEENLSDAERKQYAEAISEESLRLSAMATNVLSLSKLENTTILACTERYNISEQLRSCLLLLEAKWSAKDLEILLDLDEHYAVANAEMMKQVFLNLLDNAVKFTPRCGTVKVDVTDTDQTLFIAVSNTGSTIPRDKLDRIFTKFYQADPSRSSEGNGLGLAIVKRIIELHCGSVSAKSENGLTQFTVALPKNGI